MSTTPKPYALADRIDAAIKRICDGHEPMRIPADPTDADLVLADCREALDAAQARVKELEGRIENLRASHEYPRLQDVGRIAELEARVKELEGGHLSPGLFAEYGRLDAAWQGLVADRDAATARAEKAEARVKELEQLNDELDEQRAEYHALATYNEGLVAAAASRANHHQQALTESRANEARLREALRQLDDACAGVAAWSEECIDFDHPARVAARAALSTSASDWLAARDRRVAEAQREACVALLRELAELAYDQAAREELAKAVRELEVAPLVEFKPEGA